MPIAGLLPTLKPAMEEVRLRQFKECVVAINAHSLISKQMPFFAMDFISGAHEIVFHRNICMAQVPRLRNDCNIRPIFVFSGQQLPLKREINERKRKEREEILAEINSLLEEGDSDAAKKKAPHCAHITQELLLILLEELIKAKVDYIIAPNTANAQIAYLVREGYANFAMTEDSELILYNVRYILYKYVPAQCAGVLFDAQKLADCFVNDKDNYEYSFDSFRRLCILVGCEFLDNLKGISYNKAKKFIASVSDRDWNADLLLDMPRILSSKALVVPHEYVDKFRQVELAYDYQLVFDPKQRKLVHMNPVPSSMKSQVKQFSGLSSLTGSKLIDWVLGTLDYETLEPLSSHAHLRELAEEHLFNQEDSIWNPKCPPATVKKFQAAKTKGDVDEVAQVEKEANLAAVKRAKKEAKEQKAKAKKQKSDNSTGKGSRKSNESGKKSSKSREKVGGDSKKKKK